MLAVYFVQCSKILFIHNLEIENDCFIIAQVYILLEYFNGVSTACI